MIPGWRLPVIVTENHWFVNKKNATEKKKTVFGVHSQADQTEENVYMLNIDSVRAVPHKHYFTH